MVREGSTPEQIINKLKEAEIQINQGIDTMTIRDLGRWESLKTVQTYTRSVSFPDSLKFYEAPLSQ